jgi:hypothetical protein
VLNGACQRAIQFELIDARRLDSIVRLALEPTTAAGTPVPAPPLQPALRFLREPESFRAPNL